MWTVIARYLIAALHARDDTFFDRHRPAAFATVATPVRLPLCPLCDLLQDTCTLVVREKWTLKNSTWAC